MGFAATVPNALECVKKHAHYITKRVGGDGAYREIVDFILQAQGKLEPILQQVENSAWTSGKRPEMEVITSQEGLA